jgi:drug/metabolite transporter (DMT)-like permease
MTIIGSIASLFLKKASASDGIVALFKNINLYIGGCLYLCSALLNIWVLRKLDYSVVLPLTSFTYIWTMILSYFILKEKITAKKMIGVALIIFGAILVSI